MTGYLFIFTVSVLLAGVGADEVSVSVKVGESVTLLIKPDEIKGADELLWFFNDETKFIAKIDRETHQSDAPGNREERFRDRLKLDDQSGSLTITDVKTTDTGLYKLEISSSSKTLHKRFNVTVSDQTSHWMITGPVLAVVLLLVLLVVSFLIYKHYKKRDEML